MNTVNLARGLMTLLNIRLSDWLPNPKYGSKWRFFRDYFLANAVCLVRELFGLLNAESARINLTDGGHIENLGMYELLKRRCRFIVAIDGEQDGNLDCPALHQVIRLASIDLGAEIHFPDLYELKANEHGWSHMHFALGVVRIDRRRLVRR